MQTVPKCCIRDVSDFAIWYTPGTAELCKEIKKNPDLAYEFTNKIKGIQ
ncbi:hypothetical protein [Acetomicrobium sp.]|nr:hypothetical protein [Acetomicrobium sp.]